MEISTSSMKICPLSSSTILNKAKVMEDFPAPVNKKSKVSGCLLGAGTRSRIQARLSGMNIYYARTSKLVSDFLYLERSLVTTLAQLATKLGRVGD